MRISKSVKEDERVMFGALRKCILYVFGALVIFFPIEIAAETDGNYQYSISQGEAKITKYVGVESYVFIPNMLGNCVVTEIGRSAFENNAYIACVVMPDSVKEIGFYAFRGCTNLSSIELSANVSIIWSQAFQNCSSLTSIMPNSITPSSACFSLV